MASRKIIAFLAASADGYIARTDNDLDWLNRRRPASDYGMRAFYRTIDTILWGRRTYDVALEFQKQGDARAGFDPKVKNYVFSRKPHRSAAPGVEFVSGPISRFAKRLRARPGKNIWMMGGASLIGAFLDAGELDEFDIHVIPTLIGEGIPLIAPKHRDVPLRLLATNKYADGVVRLRYAVRH
jgi:dihydrofolate reductase